MRRLLLVILVILATALLIGCGAASRTGYIERDLGGFLLYAPPVVKGVCPDDMFRSCHVRFFKDHIEVNVNATDAFPAGWLGLYGNYTLVAKVHP